MESNRIKLNITMSYPVYWSKGKVLRDFIQNFYDAVGPEVFSQKFSWKMRDRQLEMRADTVFGKEWLYYFGTSTKRNREKSYAGRFGEGFKIAALIAYRDYHWGVTMISGEWVLKVTHIPGKIDTELVDFLAYELSERPFEENSILLLDGVKLEDKEEMEREIENFFFKDNPRFGACIMERERYAIYHLRGKQKGKMPGFVYAAYQLRGNLPVPLILCDHQYCPDEDDRDREFLYDTDTADMLYEAIKMANGMEALTLLELCKRYWFPVVLNRMNRIWKLIIYKLTDLVSRQEEARNLFYERYGKVLLAEVPCLISQERKKIARLWYRQSKYYAKTCIVDTCFERLGIRSVVDLCEEEHGFITERSPNKKESAYLQILERAASQMFFALLCYDSYPDCKILVYENIPCKALISVLPMDEVKVNSVGMRVIYRTRELRLQKKLFQPDQFAQALPAYIHELFHQFGGDCSINFHKGMLMMNRRILDNRELLERLETEWRSIE